MLLLSVLAGAGAEEQAPSPAATPKISGASYEKRLANARSVQVMTSILGVELDSDIKVARAKLDRLSDPAHPPKEEAAKAPRDVPRRRKVLWQFTEGDYAAIFVKTDAKDRITSITATVREGKEIPFEKIGDLKKAPVLTDRMVAWDVVRPKRPLFRVVASGPERKANTITWVVVKRAATATES